MADVCDVLLFGTMGLTGPVVRDAIAGRGLDVRLAGFPQNTFRDEPGYRRELLKSVASCRPRMILPIGCQLALARLKGSLPPDIVIPVDTAEKIAMLDSKVECSRLAAELGIRQPRMFTGADDVSDYPVIFKREKSFGGSGVYRPKSREALQSLMEHEPGNRYLIEELIDGDDYSVDAFRWDGIFQAGCYKSLSNRGQGPATARQSVSFPELCQISSTILDHIDYHGVCGMDFRVDKAGGIFFLECNPRFTGGIATQLEAGLDIPALYCGLLG